jgi:putative ABC transport system permease protein
MVMLKYFLASSVTYFKNNKSFLFINLIGLTTALTASYFALLYVNFELSYDGYHKNADETYRVVVDAITPNGVDYRGTSLPLAPAVRDACPEVKAATRVFLDYLIFQNEGGVQNEEKIAYVDSTLFSVFSFPLVMGDEHDVLNAPFQVVLSESSAEKYFGDSNPVGKTLLINGKDAAYVTGVMEDIPYNSHFRVDVFVSMSTLLKVWNPRMETNWKSRRTSTYVVLHPGANVRNVNTKITQILKGRIDDAGIEYITALEPLRGVYLYGKPRGSRSGSIVTGNITNVYICSFVAALVLFVAGLNYINLSTAFSIRRAKEIGIRKLLGASRLRLCVQFLTDVLIVTLIAFVASAVLITLMTPIFNQISGKLISPGIWQHPYHLALLFGVSLITGMFSGLYPAFSLSAFQPIACLKGRFVSSVQGIRLRRILVISQFLTSFILIVATIVLYKQLHFMQSHELGFRKDHMMAIDFQFDKKAASEFTKNQMLTLPGVSAVSVSSSLPGRPSMKIETRIESFHAGDELANMDAYFIDYNFIGQYGLALSAGRIFSNSLASDSTQAMIVNEAAVKYLGYHRPEDIIGKRYWQAGREGEVIGVIKDFHFESFRETVHPLTMQIGGFETFMTLSVSNIDEVSSTISMIERKWKSVVPDMPFMYFFTDDAFNAQYDAEKRFGKLFLCLVTVAITISCLGLCGLSVFSTTQRTKEIGIRKTLGSSRFDIATLLVKDFLLLIATGIFLGVPLSWYVLTKWLEEFAYRIDLSPAIFLAGAFILTMFAIATIGLQTLRAASADPVKSLRTE